MPCSPREFVNVEVLRVAVGGGDMFVVSGVAIVDFVSTDDDFQRCDLVFNIPDEGTTSPNGPFLPVPDFTDSVVAVFPASAQSTGGDIVGWAVDTADTVSNGNNVQLTATLAVRGYNTTLFRVGFHVSILTS